MNTHIAYARTYTRWLHGALVLYEANGVLVPNKLSPEHLSNTSLSLLLSLSLDAICVLTQKMNHLGSGWGSRPNAEEGWVV